MEVSFFHEFLGINLLVDEYVNMAIFVLSALKVETKEVGDIVVEVGFECVAELLLKLFFDGGGGREVDEVVDEYSDVDGCFAFEEGSSEDTRCVG